METHLFVVYANLKVANLLVEEEMSQSSTIIQLEDKVSA